jgi:hypothetical protein
VIANFLASLLEPAEREAVLGDLAERGASSTATIRELSSLVVRRQAALWLGWRHWTALLFLVVPFSLILSFYSSFTADLSSDAFWMCFHQWEWNRLPLPAFQRDLPHFLVFMIGNYAVLACWSWIVGFAIGAFSRRTAVVNGALLCLFLLLDLYVAGRLVHANGPVYAVWIYRALLAFIVQAVVVLMPAVLGMRQGVRFASFDRLMRVILMIATVFSTVPIVWLGLVWFEHFTNPPAAGPLYSSFIARRWLGFAGFWPILYWIAQATGKFKERIA